MCFPPPSAGIHDGDYDVGLYSRGQSQGLSERKSVHWTQASLHVALLPQVLPDSVLDPIHTACNPSMHPHLYYTVMQSSSFSSSLHFDKICLFQERGSGMCSPPPSAGIHDGDYDVGILTRTMATMARMPTVAWTTIFIAAITISTLHTRLMILLGTYTYRMQSQHAPTLVLHSDAVESFLRRKQLCFQRVLAIAIPSVCPSVCLSVRLSHGWIRQKRSKLGSPNLHHRLPGRP